MKKMKPKCNYKPGPLDDCYTPPAALEPILPLLKKVWTIWEPATGRGDLSKTIYDYGCDIIESDIKTGQDFFNPDHNPKRFDCIVPNPPYSKKFAWLGRCIDLGRPFALLLPLDLIGTAKGQDQLLRARIHIIAFRKRINFIIPGGGDAAPFSTAWFTYGLCRSDSDILCYWDNTKEGADFYGYE